MSCCWLYRAVGTAAHTDATAHALALSGPRPLKRCALGGQRRGRALLQYLVPPGAGRPAPYGMLDIVAQPLQGDRAEPQVAMHQSANEWVVGVLRPPATLDVLAGRAVAAGRVGRDATGARRGLGAGMRRACRTMRVQAHVCGRHRQAARDM